MSYFHVVVKTNADKKLCVYRNLSKSELKKKFVKPYKLDKILFYNGHILPTSELSKVKIISTLKRHEEELKIVQEESFKSVQEFNNSSPDFKSPSIRHSYKDYEIEKCGTDTTQRFIDGAPGEGTIYSKLGSFIKHPWVVRIFAGLLFMLAIIYFGLK